MRRVLPRRHPLWPFWPAPGLCIPVEQEDGGAGRPGRRFLDGGAYEYGTNKVAVNYGNLLTGSFYAAHRPAALLPPSGSWDTNAIPAVTPTPFSPGLGAGNQINAFSKKNDGYAPY